MSVEKLSVSIESSLAKVIRGAASDEGVSLSTWLADAAVTKARQVALREALHEHTKEHGTLGIAAAEQLIAAARARSLVSRPRKRK
jgi:uncharacterized protein (DUF1778 family)